MWTHSTEYRKTPAYRRNGMPAKKEEPADTRCISFHHDVDYCKFKLPGHEHRCSKSGRNTFKTAWRKELDKEDYWKVGAVLEGTHPASLVKSPSVHSQTSEL